ncbi:LYR motif-containing protein [Aspergillus affinis]|uniref:LYR motif-containing protein n=1 Tax=Aspergillus affinis TaxID=1070780 RepID=UPI0022FDE356|nr:uncharacterized protein KD926_004874 [Aspergillus affinis]KAI9034963.1 hypothetical protein KD926_004874 [Aspergillus affinis]
MAFHKSVVPKYSGAHRFACLALYRGLLRQCANLPTTIPELNTSRSLIRQRFRRYKKLQSPSQSVNALKAGYEAFDLLHSAAHGNQNGIQSITDLLAEAQSIQQRKLTAQKALAEARPARPPNKAERKKAEFQRHQDLTAHHHPDTEPILSRPRPFVRGKRHIPRFVSARGIPFLRIKKYQPKNLSGVIRTKLNKRWALVLRRHRLQSELLFTEDEDMWDVLTGCREHADWTSPVEDAFLAVEKQILSSDQKNRALAEKMWKVVLAERELAEKEQKEAVRENRIREGRKRLSSSPPLYFRRVLVLEKKRTEKKRIEKAIADYEGKRAERERKQTQKERKQAERESRMRKSRSLRNLFRRVLV